MLMGRTLDWLYDKISMDFYAGAHSSENQSITVCEPVEKSNAIFT